MTATSAGRAAPAWTQPILGVGLPVTLVRIGTAAVWLALGLFAKLLGLLPRHEAIVAAVAGESAAAAATRVIGAGEVVIAAWILSGIRPKACMALQTAAIVTMNALELAYAHELLLAPGVMLAANAVFLSAGWWAALRATARPPVPAPTA